MKPLFIVVDGVEGCGKSTQAELLAHLLAAQGHDVVVTHEPGGTPTGEAIRQILLDPQLREMTPLAETMLFCASRAQHCHEIIVPALEAGRIVVCDRFSSSTAVYQGYAGGLGVDAVDAIDDVATGGLAPDLLIILDVDPAVGLRRKFGDEQAKGDRIEEKSLEFHREVREGFLEYARLHSECAVVIDASAEEEEVHWQVAACVRNVMG